MSDTSHNITAWLQDLYAESEVTSGEFIHSIRVPRHWGIIKVSKKEIVDGVQEFLDWDESPETFRVVFQDDRWLIAYPFDTVTYEGKDYSVRTFHVEVIGHNHEAKYVIAPESLMDAMADKENDIDDMIYHYIQDEHFNLSAQEICEKHLDIPMKLIEEIL